MKLPSPALVIALIALFVALGGTSYAVTKIDANSVGTTQLRKQAVTAAKIKNGAVAAAKIKNSAVTSAKIRDAAVTAAKLSPTALGSQRGYYALATCTAWGTQATWLAAADRGAYAAGQGEGLMCPLAGLPTDARITKLQIKYLDNANPENLIFFIGSWNPASPTGAFDAPIQRVSTGSDPAIRTLTVSPDAEQADTLSTLGGRMPAVRVDQATASTRGVIGILVDFERVTG